MAQQKKVAYDEYGWPINPAKGYVYTSTELANDASLPLPRDDSTWCDAQMLTEWIVETREANRKIELRKEELRKLRLEKVAKSTAKRKRRRSRSTGRNYAKRNWSAASVLNRPSSYEKTNRRIGTAMAELVSRVNGSEDKLPLI